MNTLPVITSLTMSSREIAELINKEHNHVMRDIRLMLVELYGKGGESKFGHSYLSKQNKEMPEYLLPKRETLILISGYSTILRAKIIDRWQELEVQAAAQAVKINEELTWEQRRQGSKKVRADFTNTLKDHDVAGFGFAQCTNGIYQPLFGGTAKQLKAKKGLTKKDSLRDAMSVEELAFTTVAEVVASQRMDANADSGNSPCYKTCKASGEAVGSLLIKKLN